MAKTLEQFTAEAMSAYAPAKSAIQTQLGSIDSNLATANDQINRNYANQQQQLETQRNQAAEAASLQAAGSGGSFGGAANIANRKYYEQSFVPAQTKLQTNQANELAQARQNAENQRTSLNSQLANLDAQANQAALQQYWAAVEQEKARAAAAAQQNAYNKYLMDAMKAANQQPQIDKGSTDFLTWVNKYSNYDDKTKNTLTGGLTAWTKGGTSIMQNTVNKMLQQSPYYKQYLNWRNS